MARRIFNVRGMSCAACVRRVEQGVSGMDGVNDATVNFAAEKISVDYDENALSLEDVAQRVEELGYEPIINKPDPAERRSTTVMVGGMSCAACVRRVEMALERIDGVDSASVNLATSKATALHSPDASIVSEIAKTRSRNRVMNSWESQERVPWTRPKKPEPKI